MNKLNAVFVLVFGITLVIGGCSGLRLPSEVEKKEPEVIHTPLILSWELNNPERKSWSESVRNKIEKDFDVFNTAQDIEKLCGNFSKLTRSKKIDVFAELISQMAKYESSWKPDTKFQEPRSMGIDALTKKPVVSEGLLQLSYQDTLWRKESAKNCSVSFEKKNLTDAIVNLCFGIEILKSQIKKHGKIFLMKGEYWSVIRDPASGKRTKAVEIMKSVNSIDDCKIKMPLD